MTTIRLLLLIACTVIMEGAAQADAISAKACKCSDPGDCTCTDCKCPACLFWAYDSEGGGYDLCTKRKVVGYLYPSGKFLRRDVHDGYTTWTPARLPIKPPMASVEGATDALDEVNAARARLGLHPFKRDPGLTTAALRCARHRADRLIEGHVNDFAFLPAGCKAGASGCAAWPQGAGWGSCCWKENWEYAGAAYAIGRDGRRYMHIFVRRGSME